MTGDDGDNHRKRWTEADDVFLLEYAPAVGFWLVASHDLGRTEAAGRRRYAWLHKNRPDLVERVAARVQDFERIVW